MPWAGVAAWANNGSVVTKLEDRNAIVTGGGGAIGRAIAARLAEDGAAVGVLDKDQSGAEATVEAIELAGGRAVSIPVDITDHPSVVSAVARCETELGPTDILVNCAGWDHVARFIETDPGLWDTLIAVNLKGPIHLHHAVLPGMIERRRGRVVNIASDAGRVGSSGEAVYAACKGGIISFSKAIAREVAGKRINVNVVCPGPTDTPLLASFLDAGDYGRRIHESLTKVIPFKRLGEPKDMAGIVAFLAGDDASYITGQVVSVSGGLTMHG